MKIAHRLSPLFLLACLPFLMGSDSCGNSDSSNQPVSASGVQKASVTVPIDQHGNTVEQRNIAKRLVEDNRPGSIKHLYIISAYSGQVLIYSTVAGKVTSGGKRLTPTTVSALSGDYNYQGSFIPVAIGGVGYRTNEVLQDDGTYGHSGDYLYWWDTRGVYHQHYLSGGQIPHISSEPLVVKNIIINMELTNKTGAGAGE